MTTQFCQQPPLNEGEPYANAGLAIQAHAAAVNTRINMGWRRALPEEWGWRALLGDLVVGNGTLTAVRPWAPTVFTPAPIREAPALLSNERFMLQRWHAGRPVRVLAEGPHLLVTTPDRAPVAIDARTTAALQQWQFNRGDFEVEGVLLPDQEGITLMDWIDPPSSGRSALDRWQVIQQSVLPEPLERTFTAFSAAGKQELWELALRDAWEGVIFRRQQIAHVKGESAYDFFIDPWHTGLYIVDQLLPKPRGQPRRLTVKFPTEDGVWVVLGEVEGRALTRADWRTLEQFRGCNADAVVRVQYAYWEPLAKKLIAGRVVALEPRLCRPDCVDSGVYLASGTQYLF